jgi:hypothetical protein
MIEIGSIWEFERWTPTRNLVVIVTGIHLHQINIRYMYNTDGHGEGTELVDQFFKYYKEVIY